MLVLSLAITQPVAAQSFKPDYKAGTKAFLQKDYATAVKNFRPVAKTKDFKMCWAQLYLGLMYRDGLGVLQDLVMAYVWLNLAATNGLEYLDNKDRDKVLSRLTAPERKLALKLSKLCLRKPAKCPEYSDN